MKTSEGSVLLLFDEMPCHQEAAAARVLQVTPAAVLAFFDVHSDSTTASTKAANAVPNTTEEGFGCDTLVTAASATGHSRTNIDQVVSACQFMEAAPKYIRTSLAPLQVPSPRLATDVKANTPAPIKCSVPDIYLEESMQRRYITHLNLADVVLVPVTKAQQMDHTKLLLDLPSLCSAPWCDLSKRPTASERHKTEFELDSMICSLMMQSKAHGASLDWIRSVSILSWRYEEFKFTEELIWISIGGRISVLSVWSVRNNSMGWQIFDRGKFLEGTLTEHRMTMLLQWPPPRHFEMQASGVQLPPIPWPSFSSYETTWCLEKYLSVALELWKLWCSRSAIHFKVPWSLQQAGICSWGENHSFALQIKLKPWFDWFGHQGSLDVPLFCSPPAHLSLEDIHFVGGQLNCRMFCMLALVFPWSPSVLIVLVLVKDTGLGDTVRMQYCWLLATIIYVCNIICSRNKHALSKFFLREEQESLLGLSTIAQAVQSLSCDSCLSVMFEPNTSKMIQWVIFLRSSQRWFRQFGKPPWLPLVQQNIKWRFPEFVLNRCRRASIVEMFMDVLSDKSLTGHGEMLSKKQQVSSSDSLCPAQIANLDAVQEFSMCNKEQLLTVGFHHISLVPPRTGVWDHWFKLRPCHHSLIQDLDVRCCLGSIVLHLFSLVKIQSSFQDAKHVIYRRRKGLWLSEHQFYNLVLEDP